MQSDLKGLEITGQELKNLTGMDVDKGLKLLGNGVVWKTIIFTIILFIPAFFVSAIFWIIIFPILDPSFNSNSDNPLPPILSLIMAFILARYAAKVTVSKIKQQNHPNNKSNEDINPLSNLIKDVEKINSIVKAIHVNDQLEEAGNKGMSLNDRSKAIEALKLTRQDLVCALKTERILRENKDVIISNPDLFANNLSGIRALQITEKATEFGKILGNALQVALDVQEEMKKLQNMRSS